jgi:sugar lactone lactonase YvrE
MGLILLLFAFIHPESCLMVGETLFVSDVGNFNNPNDGKIYAVFNGKSRVYADGLADPKGIVYVGGTIFVADINKVWKIRGKAKEVFVSQGEFPEEPNFLNDVAADEAGNLYISDTFKGIVFKVTPTKQVSLYVRVESPNGLLYHDGKLYIAIFTNPGKVLVYDGEKLDTLFVSPDIKMADGLAFDRERNLLYVSGYGSGEIVQIDLNTKRPKVIKRRLRTPADISLDPSGNYLLVPQLDRGKVDRFEVK